MAGVFRREPRTHPPNFFSGKRDPGYPSYDLTIPFVVFDNRIV